MEGLSLFDDFFSALDLCSPWWPLVALCCLAVATFALYSTRPRTLYLVDFVAQRPPDSWANSRDVLITRTEDSNFFGKESLQFQHKVLFASGMGNGTYAPDWLRDFPQDTSISKARYEFECVGIKAAEDLLQRTGVQRSQIGVVVVNSSVFCPTPSLAAQLMNHLKLNTNTLNYNLGGMGCAGSPVAVEVAQQALALRPGSYALVVSTEVICRSIYKGTQRSMQVSNVLFRSGAAAMLLTYKSSEARRAKYRLHSLVRTNYMAEDAAFAAAQELEDHEDFKGLKLSKDIPKIAAKALKLNFIELMPKIMPLSEKALFAANHISRKWLGRSIKPYRPNFQKCAQHICIHTGGKAVIDGIQKELGLTARAVESSRASLYRFGNTSCSSIWYVLAYVETFFGLSAGDRVVQLAFGSGFKCNSMVWTANRSIKFEHPAWQGFDLADMYDDLHVMEGQLRQLLAQMAAEKAAALAVGDNERSNDAAVMAVDLTAAASMTAATSMDVRAAADLVDHSPAGASES